MRKIVENALELIGNTPILKLNRYGEGRIYAKLEGLNPAGSSKDRIALAMVVGAEERKELKPRATIIEPTSGNTGIGLAMVAAARGYHAIFTMPETMSVERQTMLKAYGASIVLTSGKEGMAGAIRKAQEMQNEIEGAVILNQFGNEDNPKAHLLTTGPEIWNQMEGKIDIFIAGVGTGGTITGTGMYLKEQNSDIKVIAVEPAGSPVLSQGKAGKHSIQGIGAGFVPDVLNKEVIDEVITITDEEAFQEGREFASTEGILVGISSGAVLKAAKNVANREENKEKTILAFLPDNGDRYLSTPMFL